MTIHIPGQPLERTIALQTREAWDIPNNQPAETSPLDQRQLQEFKRRWSQAAYRTGAIPAYNCHGLTFAARRTRIWETTAVTRILSDDRYEEVLLDEVQAGDIVLYSSAEDGDLEHSAIVVEPPYPPLRMPKVWGKWGSGAEVVHFANYGPYDVSRARYYRIRS